MVRQGNDCKTHEVATNDSYLCKTAKSYFECKDVSWGGKVKVTIEIELSTKYGVHVEPLLIQHTISFRGTGQTNVIGVPIPVAF